MNLEQLLEQHLQASAAEQPAYPADVEAIKARGNRRRFTNRLMIASGVAAAVVLTVALATSLFPGERGVVAPTPTTSPTTTAPIDPSGPVSTLENAVAFFGEDGLTIQADGVDRLVPGDLYYESIYALIPDGFGGLMFQHGIAPPPWSQSSIMRLPAGASMPEVVVSGEGLASDSSRLIIGPVADGFAYAEWSGSVADETTVVVHVADLSGSDDRVVLNLTFPTTTMSTELIAAQYDRIALVEDKRCAEVHIYDVGVGGSEWSWTLDCELTPTDLTLSPDGRQLVILAWSTNENGGVTRQLLRFDTSLGLQGTVDAGDVWLVAWGSDEEVLAVGEAGAGSISLDNGRFTPIRQGSNFRLGNLGTVILADDATTGSRVAGLPCNPSTIASPNSTEWMTEADQAVTDTWEELRDLAATCEWEQLSDLAEQDQTSLSFGGQIRLAKLWVLDAASGFDTGKSLIDVTSVAPARTTDGWIWPAVASTNADADWQVLLDAGVLTEQEVAAMKEFGGYIGYRVGIADDGTWLFGIAGD